MTVSRKRLELAAVKEYLDEHFTEKIVLEELAEKFFINKFYLWLYGKINQHKF